MLVAGFAAGAFQANCYLLATGDGTECVIVDPGQDAVTRIDEALAEHRLTPVAVLATHGHFDHVYSAREVADAHGIPVYIHGDDRELLSDPLKGLGPQLSAMFGGQVQMTEPARVVELDGTPLELAGLSIAVDLTPGHTPGSVIFRLSTDEGGEVALTGDTLFAGAIGRTDLPGGDMARMQESLRDTVLSLPDRTVVLPGHGTTSTIGDERASNPFLAGLTPAHGAGSG
ncbi:Glyoxylase, beta-lactamase superfamily II [Haloechinothrix alba]|uniref:Glyoxylase, beta-lactamase superfamily II n=1 Tax=Haloechinothrix alba TaxID=664784 RepID=A0A238WZF2_9PSEU|nr:MBL fold metallo-hydrolase [Haloechinothrix alba]SNR51788.1 Glyoxylase, beta-lactamase superfamily II [Haloechinothrix alba]